jgi:putative SOS response-associated peptidase YedK
MCGRFVLPTKEALCKRLSGVCGDAVADFTPLFNVPPTSQVPMVVKGEDGTLELSSARWGLIPEWWQKPEPPSLTFNARSEEAATKPTWRDSLQSRRCLMPARGWFEWNPNQLVLTEAGKEVKQPYFIFCPEEPVITFAGMWSLWERPGLEPVLSCALLSKQAAGAIASIHHRMPVVLAPDQQAAWLQADTSASDVQQLIAHASEDLRGHPVSTRVNSVKNDFSELLDPVTVHSMDLFQQD